MAVVDGRIRCPECGERKPVGDYAPGDAARGSGYCRPCKKSRKRAWQSQNRKRDNARRRARYRMLRDPDGQRKLDEIRANRKARIVPSLTKEYSLRYRLKTRYGMSEYEYDRILISQGGCCACCGAKRNIDGRMWCIDHDHETGQIRGILCTNCNAGIGALGDTLSGVMRAVRYLKQNAAAGCVVKRLREGADNVAA